MSSEKLVVILIVCASCAVLGLLFVVIGAVMAASHRRALRRLAGRTEGVVTAMERHASLRSAGEAPDPGENMLYPSFSYTVDGVAYERDSNATASRPRLAVGDRVEVVFDPANPADARLTMFIGAFSTVARVFEYVGFGIVVISFITAVICAFVL